MSAITASHDQQDVQHANGHVPSYASQLKRNRMGLWMFFFSELFMFGALLAARFALWGNTRPPLSQVLGLITTVVLLLSSFYMNRAESAVAHDDRKTLLSGLLTTALLGTLFFIGVVVLEWNVFGLKLELFGVEWFGHLKPGDGVFGGVFFAMTGMHALHVVSGIVLILIVWNNSRKGHFSVEEHWGIEACAIYWHFVDVIWVFFYPALYLIGNAA